MDESEENLWEDEEAEAEELEDKDSEGFEDEEEVQPTEEATEEATEETPVGHGHDQVVSVDSDDDSCGASQQTWESPEKALEMESAPIPMSPNLNEKIQELQKKLALARKEQTAKTLDVNIKSYFFLSYIKL